MCVGRYAQEINEGKTYEPKPEIRETKSKEKPFWRPRMCRKSQNWGQISHNQGQMGQDVCKEKS